MSSLLRLECKQNNSSNQFLIRIFLFLSFSFAIETRNTFVHSCSSLENHTRFQTKMGKVYTRFQTKIAQTLPDGAAPTYIAYIREYPLPPGTQHETTDVIDLTKLPPWGLLARNSYIVQVHVTSTSGKKFQLHNSVKYLNSTDD